MRELGEMEREGWREEGGRGGGGRGGWVTEHGCTYVVVRPSTTVTKILFFKSRVQLSIVCTNAQMHNSLQDLSGQSLHGCCQKCDLWVSFIVRDLAPHCVYETHGFLLP